MSDHRPARQPAASAGPLAAEKQRRERELPFRRRRFVGRHRQRGVWLQLVKPFLGALAMVAAPLALAAWFATSPRFRLAEVAVDGCQRVPTAWVSEVLGPLAGRPLLQLSLPEVERRLLDHPWIDRVEIHKDFPDRLTVQIVERLPAALLRRPDGGLWYVDRGGRVIDAFDPAAGPADLVVLTAAREEPRDLAAGLDLADDLARLAPEWAAGLSEIEVLNEGDFRFYTAALPFPVLVSAARLAPAVLHLRRYASEILQRYARVASVDLRFARQIVIQPAVVPLS